MDSWKGESLEIENFVVGIHPDSFILFNRRLKKFSFATAVVTGIGIGYFQSVCAAKWSTSQTFKGLGMFENITSTRLSTSCAAKTITVDSIISRLGLCRFAYDGYFPSHMRLSLRRKGKVNAWLRFWGYICHWIHQLWINPSSAQTRSNFSFESPPLSPPLKLCDSTVDRTTLRSLVVI